MLGTIIIGSCVSVQGEIIRHHADGRMSVRVGNLTFTGRAANPTRGAGVVPMMGKAGAQASVA